MDIYMKWSMVLLSICLLGQQGCVYKNKSIVNKDESKTVIADDCISLAKKLVTGSSYKNIMNEKEVDLFVDNFSDSVILVHATHSNEEKRDVTVGWIKIDLINTSLADITINPDSPTVIASFDKDVFKKLKKACKDESVLEK